MAPERYTDNDFLSLCRRYGWRCLCCGQRGHLLAPVLVVPMERGGTAAITNIQPLCEVCQELTTGLAVDFRVRWLAWHTPTSPGEPGANDFDYGMVPEEQRLLIYQRTQAIQRLLQAVHRDLMHIHEKIGQVDTVLNDVPVRAAWFRTTVLPLSQRIMQQLTPLQVEHAPGCDSSVRLTVSWNAEACTMRSRDV